MTKFSYKSFDVSYEIRFSHRFKHYEASGEVSRLEDGQVTFSQEFRTEESSLQAAEEEIKKMMMDYIDVEWQQFTLVHQDIAKNFKYKQI